MRQLCMMAICAGLLSLRAENLTGVTSPHREANLSVAVPGLVAKVLVNEGQTVEKGDVLLELQQEQEVLERSRRKLLLENRSEILAAEARLATARSEVKSTQLLFDETRSVSREELERKLLQEALAEAELTQAQMNKTREEIELAMAHEAVERRRLRAPHAGKITEILIEEGEGCEPLQPLMRLVDVTRLIFTANVEATQLRQFSPGQTVRIKLEGGMLREGSVRYISPVVDRASGLGILRVEFENEKGDIVAGIPAELLLTEQP
jgi:RND family efflux transporter MFP subunit